MSTFTLPAFAANDSALTVESNVERSESIFTRAVKTTDRTGERLRLRLQYRNLETQKRAQLSSTIARLNGQQHRVVARDPSYTGPRGALSVSELLQLDFTTWTPHPTYPERATSTALVDGIRVTSGYDTNGIIVRPSGGAYGINERTAGNNYAAKLAVSPAAPGPLGGLITTRLEFRVSDWGQSIAVTPATSDGDRLVLSALSYDDTKLFLRTYVKFGATDEPGSFQDQTQLTAARCLLVDNPNNELTYSNDVSHADWDQVRTTVNADQVVGPYGGTTADEVVEDSTPSASHYIRQIVTRASVQEFWTGLIHIKKNTRQRLRVDISDGAGNNCAAYFDADSGTITGGPTLVGTALYPYATMHDLSNGWYACRVTCQLPASTGVHLIGYLCEGATNVATYNGDGASSMYVSSARLIRGVQHGRYVDTTASAITSANQTGKNIVLKGLDVNVPGQLLAGDQLEINGQLCILDSDLDGDELGTGIAQVTPRIRNGLPNNAPVIIYRPEGRFLLEQSAEWVSRVGRNGPLSDFALELVEDIT